MTQITQEQREHWEAVAAQTTAKLQAFDTELTPDERAILSLGLWQAMAEAAGADESVAGFARDIEGRNPWVRLAQEVGKTVIIGWAVEGVNATLGAIAGSVGSQVPDGPPTTSPVWPGRRGP